MSRSVARDNLEELYRVPIVVPKYGKCKVDTIGVGRSCEDTKKYQVTGQTRH